MSFDDPDMGLKKFSSFLVSLKNDAKPLLSNIASGARARISDPRLPLYSDNSSEFTSNKDTLSSHQPGITQDANGNPISALPEDSEITIYPSYTLFHEGMYHVEVRGWLTAPGTMSRTNKVLFSLAKQLIKPGAAPPLASSLALLVTGHFQGSTSDLSLIYSSDTPIMDQSSINSAPEYTEDILRNRMAYFFAKLLAGVPLDIIVCAAEAQDTAEFVSKTIKTDLNGKFEIVVETPYRPLHVQVGANMGTREPVLAFQEVLYICPEGVSVISDIDDTIKATDVTSDKRTVFNNVFVRDLKESAIEGVPDWYAHMYSAHNCLFHYVSNSPWQLYPTIRQFFELLGFPPGLVHLKQYTGNILSSLMEPAAERKRHTLFKIFSEFPERKFILIGDSGEQDFDAYMDVCRRFSDQVLRIYIRVVPGSMSDFSDLRILNEISRMLELRRERITLKKEYMRFSNSLDKKPPLPPRKGSVPSLGIRRADTASLGPREASEFLVDLNISFQAGNLENFEPRVPSESTPDLIDISEDTHSSLLRSELDDSSEKSALTALDGKKPEPKEKPKRPPKPEKLKMRGHSTTPTKPSTLKEDIQRAVSSEGVASLAVQKAVSGGAFASPAPPKPRRRPPPKPSPRKKPPNSAPSSSLVAPGPSGSARSAKPPAPPPRSVGGIRGTRLADQVDLVSQILFDPSVVNLHIDAGTAAASGVVMDRKGEVWLQKVQLALNSGVLKDDTDIVFWTGPSDVEDDAEEILSIVEQQFKS